MKVVKFKRENRVGLMNMNVLRILEGYGEWKQRFITPIGLMRGERRILNSSLFPFLKSEGRLKRLGFQDNLLYY